MPLPFFSYRSVTLTAYSALSDAAPTIFYRGAIPVGITDAVAGASSAIGSKVLDLNGAAAANGANLTFFGYSNLSLSGGQQLSILWRGSFGITSAGNLVLASIGGGVSGYYPNLFGFATNNGDLRVQIFGPTGAAIYNTTGFGWSGNAAGMTRGVMYDLLVSYNGATNASNLKVWLNGTLVQTSNASPVIPAYNIQRMIQICIGGGMNGITDATQYVNEVCIWNTEIAADSVTLTGLTGATTLSGISRTEFVEATPFNGHYSLDPGIANVASGVTYAINGVSLTGTAATGSGGTSGKMRNVGRMN